MIKSITLEIDDQFEVMVEPYANSLRQELDSCKIKMKDTKLTIVPEEPIEPDDLEEFIGQIVTAIRTVDEEYSDEEV